MQTRSQRFALTVYDRLTEYTPETPKAKKIGILAHRLPILVRKAGLAQALAFADTRQGGEGQEFLDHLAVVVNHQDRQALLRFSREAQFQEYMYLTNEVMTALEWFKRFSVSVLNVKAGDDLNDADEGS